jgi:predicted HicB family RNase H-like nuclease
MKYKTVKIEMEIHDKLKLRACKTHISIQDIVNTMLEEKLEEIK